MNEARQLDKFFTTSRVAAECVGLAQAYCRSRFDKWLWIEPSAGGGAFLDHLPRPSIALDIDPQRDDIGKIDFLAWEPGHLTRPAVIVGNPPFGKNSSLARRFFDHGASFAEAICFILPRTFQKPGFVARLDRHMHLVSETELADESFVFDGQPYRVPTVFQIWERRECLRPLPSRELSHADFAFTAAHTADFAFQRVGARAGLVSYEGLRKSPQSHYFIKSSRCAHVLFERLATIDWSNIKYRTAGNPSISKTELIMTYRSAYA